MSKYPSVDLDRQLHLNGKLYTEYKIPKKLKPDIAYSLQGVELLCKENNLDYNEIESHLHTNNLITIFWNGIWSKYNTDDILYFIDNSFTGNWRHYVKSLPKPPNDTNIYQGYIPCPTTLKKIYNTKYK